MSLLLEALRKAERDRTLGQPPSPAAIVAAPTPMPSGGETRFRGRFRTLIALIVLVSLCAIALLIRPERSAPAPGPAVTATAAPTRLIDTPVSPVPDPSAIAPVNAPTPTPMRLAQIDVADPPGRPISLPSGEVPAGTPLAEDPASEDLIGPALETLQQPVADPAPETVPAFAPPPAALPDETTNTTVSPAPGAPTLKMLPADQRARFPPVSLDVHVWDSAPERRFVLVGGKRYAPGDQLPGDLTLREIVPDGIIVEFEGRRVMVPRPG